MDRRPAGIMVRDPDFDGLGALGDLVVDGLSPFGPIVIEEWSGAGPDPVVLLAMLGRRGRLSGLGLMTRIDAGRPPSVLAKLLSGLDVATGTGAFVLIAGRVGVVSEESERIEFERVEEARALIDAMSDNDATTFAGVHYRVDDAWNTPRRQLEIPGFSRTMHVMGVPEILARTRIGLPLPDSLVVELDDTAPDECGELALVLDALPPSAVRVGVVTFPEGSVAGGSGYLGSDGFAQNRRVAMSLTFDAMLYRFTETPNARFLGEFWAALRPEG